jgi:hypothetical protein
MGSRKTPATSLYEIGELVARRAEEQRPVCGIHLVTARVGGRPLVAVEA